MCVILGMLIALLNYEKVITRKEGEGRMLNINNILQTPGQTEPAGVKKPVELHHIFSNEVLANTILAFEKMQNMKIIDGSEFEKTQKFIEKLKNEKKNTVITGQNS